ncbi:D-xylose 1-dehydrogenase (NADP(+)) [Friedmanniomyces endolithicus]|nr:D-xylose 1-dehydrogenase (NADP(+)) [Friedmanniomyces endolithicus]
MSKFTVKWGILATGGIAETFARDLWPNPECRGVKDIEHKVVAAASSSSAKRAQDFLKEVRGVEGAKAYGSYEELVKDENVDIIYIATPHSHHYQNAMLCLEAGKNVLCEKAFTTNAPQLEALIKKAREKKVFLMEAVWTRYFPLSIYVRDIITSGKIGPVSRTSADLSMHMLPEKTFEDTHRMVNPDLAGGALLDLGIYALGLPNALHHPIRPQTPDCAEHDAQVQTRHRRADLHAPHFPPDLLAGRSPRHCHDGNAHLRRPGRESLRGPRDTRPGRERRDPNLPPGVPAHAHQVGAGGRDGGG